MLILYRARFIPRIALEAPAASLANVKLCGALLTLGALGFGGCAQSPQQIAAASHGKEYFPSSVYGRASRKVVADGEPVPHGGGQYLVGKPYTIAGQTYYPSERTTVQVGNASWYGDAFHGRLTANGEVYDSGSFTAAHPTMPLPSYARVTNLKNNYSMIVRVNDRGPYHSNRIMDVSKKVADALDFRRYGTTKLKVEYVGRASLAGSDDNRLYATLRQDGPARWQSEPTMVAAAPDPARVASLTPYAPSPRRYVAPSIDPETTERAERPMPAYREAAPRVRPAPVDAMPTASSRARPAPQTYRTAIASPARDNRMPVHLAHLERHDDRSITSRIERSRDSEPESKRFAAQELRHPAHGTRLSDAAPMPPSRGAKTAGAIMPPSRPIGLGTMSSAGNQVGHHHNAGLRMARARDE